MSSGITSILKTWLRLAFTRHTLAGVVSLALLISTVPAFSHSEQPSAGVYTMAQPAAAQERELNRIFSAYEMLELDLKEITQTVESTKRLSLRLGGKQRNLRLEKKDLRSGSFRSTIMTDKGEIEEPLQPVSTYRGWVEGEEGSEVRLLVLPDLFFGYVRTEKEWIFIDPLSKYAPDARSDQVVVYRDEDVRPESAGTCGATELEKKAEEFVKADQSAAAIVPAAVTSRPRWIEIATDADFQFLFFNASLTNSLIQGIINNVDGIYSSELNLSFVITFQNVWLTNNQPYTSTNPNTLLDQFKDEWNANRTAIQRDVAHLFTGKNLDGNIIGIAFTGGGAGVVCRIPTLAYGLTSSNSGTSKTVAHEIGHNLSAAHDDQLNPPTANCNGSGPLMCSAQQGNGPNRFSQRSKDDIAALVNSFGSCLEDKSSLQVGISSGAAFNAAQWDAWVTYPDMKELAGDFNGDGKTDVMKFDVPSSGTSCSSGLWVGLSDGTRFNTTLWDTWCMNRDVKVLAGDFDGNGKTDVMKFDMSSSGQCNGGLWVGLSDGTRFNTTPWANWCAYPDMKVLVGDFNGDGRDDVMKFDVLSSGFSSAGLWVGLSDSVTGPSGITTRFFNTNLWATWDTSRDIKVLAGDFNGDGKTDVMKFDVLPSGISQLGLWVGLSDPSRPINQKFVTTEWARWDTYTDMKVLVGDFNGDGRDDVMKFDVLSSGFSSAGLWVGLSDLVTGPGNNTTRFFNSNLWGTWDTSRDIKVLAGDFNGDGKTDVMKFDVVSGRSQLGLWVGLSDPSRPRNQKFVTTQWARWLTYPAMKVLAGDFDGDHKAEVMKFNIP